MLMLLLFVVAACYAFAATLGDVCAYVVVSGNVVVAAISSLFVASFNICVTRSYMCTRIVRTARV
jgi:hypothetical protein